MKQEKRDATPSTAGTKKSIVRERLATATTRNPWESLVIPSAAAQNIAVVGQSSTTDVGYVHIILRLLVRVSLCTSLKSLCA